LDCAIFHVLADFDNGRGADLLPPDAASDAGAVIVAADDHSLSRQHMVKATSDFRGCLTHRSAILRRSNKNKGKLGQRPGLQPKGICANLARFEASRASHNYGLASVPSFSEEAG